MYHVSFSVPICLARAEALYRFSAVERASIITYMRNRFQALARHNT